MAAARARQKADAGTTLVEFAFVAMVLLTMMLGIVDFSRGLYAYHFTSNEARQASRWAAVNGYTCANDTSTTDTGGSCNGMNGMNNGPASAAQIQAYVKSQVPLGMDPNAISASVSWPVQSDSPAICSTAQTNYSGSPYPNYPGCTVKVQVSYQFNFLYPIVRNGSITLSSASEMVIAH